MVEEGQKTERDIVSWEDNSSLFNRVTGNSKVLNLELKEKVVKESQEAIDKEILNNEEYLLLANRTTKSYKELTLESKGMIVNTARRQRRRRLLTGKLFTPC